MSKLTKKQLFTYGILIILCLLVLPIFPLVLGLYVAYGLFKNTSSKKKGVVYAVFILVVAFFASGVTATTLPGLYGTPTPKQEEREEVINDEVHMNQKTEVEEVDTSNIENTTAPNNPNIVHKKVAFVIDGDTFELENGERVRFIGIDTPETPDECYSKEAAEKTKQLIDGVVVGLKKDVSETDKYGRLLRYVYMGDLFINDVLVREGYAKVTTYPPDVQFQEQLLEAEREARKNKRGLWGEACHSTPEPTVKAASTISSTTQSSNVEKSTSNHSCIGPDLDCSDFSTHAEAQQFFDDCGFSANYDPMRLDAVGVGDGIACESLP